MSYLVNQHPEESYCEEFRNLIDDLDLTGNIELYQDYNSDSLYEDVCTILKLDLYIKERSLLSAVR